MGKELIEELLDVLVKMSEHCTSMSENKPKCKNCAMKRDFGYSNSGCLLVDLVDNVKVMELIEYTCKYQNIEYLEKLNKIASIFVTECE